MEDTETKNKKDNGFEIDKLLLDSVSTLERMKGIKKQLRRSNNEHGDYDKKLLDLYSKTLYLHILNNLDDVNKMM